MGVACAGVVAADAKLVDELKRRKNCLHSGRTFQAYARTLARGCANGKSYELQVRRHSSIN
jgi:hypothetical protein